MYIHFLSLYIMKGLPFFPSLTCCVRDNAERKALGNVTWLKEVRKQRPQMIIAVCGCMIQEPGMAEKILKQYKFVDLAFGTANMMVM